MKIIASKSILSDAISMVQRVVTSRSTMPVLDGILLVADEKLTLTGYDMETGIECKVDTEIREKGTVLVNAKILGDIIRKLPDDIVSLSSESDENITIRSGKSCFNIKTLKATEYPVIPVVEEAHKLQIKQNVFKEMVAKTIFAASTDESRPILNGLNVVISAEQTEIVAIDGFRLAVRIEPSTYKNEEMQFIVPGKAIAEAARIMDHSDAPLSIFPSHNHILFDNGKVKLVSRLINGDFMQYRSILPRSFSTRVYVSPKEMLEAIERASLVINVEQRRFPVSVTNPSQTELLISARTELGAVEEYISMEMEGENLNVDFNPKYFLDALRNIEDEKIMLEFSGSASPCLLKPVQGNKFLYLLLPLRR